MYYLVSHNYKTGIDKIIIKYRTFDNVHEMMENIAYNFILSKQGDIEDFDITN